MFLESLISAFSNLPYENVSKIISFSENDKIEGAMRCPETVWEGYRKYGLGGTCFSLTNLLRVLLRRCAFRTSYFLADMRVAKDCHCGLIVHENGVSYLIDPGYLILRPIDLSQVPCRCTTQLNDVIITFESNRYHVFTETNHSGRKLRYSISSIFDEEEPFYAAWKRSFALNSMNSLCLNKVFGSEQVYFHRDKFRISTHNEKKNIAAKDTKIKLISEFFSIDEHCIRKADEILRGKRYD